MTRRIQILIFGLTLLFATLACAAVTDIFSPEDQPAQPNTPPTEIPHSEPRPEPDPATEAASCPAALTEIMNAAATPSEADTSIQEETYIVTYEVSGNEIADPFYETVSSDLRDEQDDAATHEDVWNYFTALIPANQREAVAEYSITTDGPDNTLASVTQTTYDPALWALEVDIVDVSDRANLTYTLVHEFGHLLTLNANQVPPSLAVFNNPDDNDIYLQEVSACPVYFPGEGCSTEDSYINAFYNKFWVQHYEEWQEINQIEDDDKYYEELDNFYYNYEDEFVTDYAVTNPEEDIAESWSFFVLGPKPGAFTVDELKILFFYDYPELVQLRNEILNNLCAVYQ